MRSQDQPRLGNDRADAMKLLGGVAIPLVENDAIEPDVETEGWEIALELLRRLPQYGEGRRAADLAQHPVQED
jgi:hypothetical protein